jgi:hypothetical protein
VFKRLVIERRNNRFGNEEKLLALHALNNDIPVVPAYEKTVARGHFKFRPDDLVAGSVGFMHHAMRQFGIAVIHEQPYPAILGDLMHRKVLPIRSMYELRRYFIQGGRPVFAKPLQTKKFTGFVADHIGDPRFNGAGNQTELIVTEVVEFADEWRVYVANGKIMKISATPGPRKTGMWPLWDFLNGIVKRLNEAATEHAPAAYSLDIGVLSTGHMALVEINDGYSLGAYDDISARDYWDVIATRWAQLTGASNNVN